MKIVPKVFRFYDSCAYIKGIEVGSDKCLECKHLIKQKEFNVYCSKMYNKNNKKHYYVDWSEIKE